MFDMMCNGMFRCVEVCTSLRTVLPLSSYDLLHPHLSTPSLIPPMQLQPDCGLASLREPQYLLFLASGYLHLFKACCSPDCFSTICPHFCLAKSYSSSRSGLRLPLLQGVFLEPHDELSRLCAPQAPKHITATARLARYWLFPLQMVS